jgi:pimeloyl-ACP methyl ester carboxylesterase
VQTATPRTLRLRDGRRLAYDEVGDPAGAPVLYLHGGGDSRLSRHPDDSIAAELGVRLLAVDRCGPAARGRSLWSCAEEMLGALPDAPFSIVGWSAGGPHALAVAAIAGPRVRRVALVG